MQHSSRNRSLTRCQNLQYRRHSRDLQPIGGPRYRVTQIMFTTIRWSPGIGRATRKASAGSSHRALSSVVLRWLQEGSGLTTCAQALKGQSIKILVDNKRLQFPAKPAYLRTIRRSLSTASLTLGHSEIVVVFELILPLVANVKHQEAPAARQGLKDQVLLAKDSVLAAASIREAMLRAPKVEEFQLTWLIVWRRSSCKPGRPTWFQITIGQYSLTASTAWLHNNTARSSWRKLRICKMSNRLFRVLSEQLLHVNPAWARL